MGALIFRGVAFEFRAHGRRSGRRLWTFAFSAGSILAAVSQGFVLGAFVQGITVRNQAFAGGPLDWLTPFSCLTAIALPEQPPLHQVGPEVALAESFGRQAHDG